MDYTIRLEQMEFRALHGCYAMEQRVGNRFAVDLEITSELDEVAATDDVTKAVSYLTVYEIVEAQMKVTRHTIEAVAVQIINALKEEFPQIVAIRCTVAKIAPPLGGKIDRVSVTVVDS